VDTHDGMGDSPSGHLPSDKEVVRTATFTTKHFLHQQISVISLIVIVIVIGQEQVRKMVRASCYNHFLS
jgi:hypothetical protein